MESIRRWGASSIKDSKFWSSTPFEQICIPELAFLLTVRNLPKQIILSQIKNRNIWCDQKSSYTPSDWPNEWSRFNGRDIELTLAFGFFHAAPSSGGNAAISQNFVLTSEFEARVCAPPNTFTFCQHFLRLLSCCWSRWTVVHCGADIWLWSNVMDIEEEGY